jgi:phosphoenolpyruvate carboxylase
MSTQHPDNVNMPLFASGQTISMDEEIEEACWAYSLGIDEQMWDFEGKKTLPGVVSELLTQNQDFFKENPLGKNYFLTLRIPNPAVEKNEAKSIPGILSSIPRSYDVAKTVSAENPAPIFEVIVPMTTAVEQLDRIYNYYKYHVVKNSPISPGDITVAEWLGEFKPKTINVIPLFEDKDSLLNAASIVKDYLKGKNLKYQRVFLARSDPALNYGVLPAVLLLNVALQRLHKLEGEVGIPVYPIIGAGDGFRGNFRPTKVDSILKGYPSCQTFTIQSSFKFDWPMDVVADAIRKINSAKRGEPIPVDEKKSLFLIEKSATAYKEQISEIALLVSHLTPFIPKRRLRRLHIGLFGYSRNSGKVHLPRAIPFCASLYSIGLPPGILGLYTLNSEDLKRLKEIYPEPNFSEDLRDALALFNPESLSLITPTLRKQVARSLKITDFETNKEHQEITSEIIKCYKKQRTEHLSDLVLEAGRIRKFLG